jgi:anti-sigma regulatory factor (Ser/Thr protein kinase)
VNRKWIFSGKTEDLASMREEVRGFLRETCIDDDVSEVIVLAIDEACTNIIRHAYKGEAKPFRIEMSRLKNRLRFVLRDYGIPCEKPKIQSRDLDEIRPGGLGVHIIQQVFDLVEYSPKARGTRLTLEKMTS